MTMCQTCKNAGKLNRWAISEAERFGVESLHKCCEFPASCTCQHKTGVWFQRWDDE